MALLNPIARELEHRRNVLPEEVAALARIPYARPLLHHMLTHYQRLDLFPEEFNSRDQQAQAELAYWLMHPNELRGVPAEMHLIKVVSRSLGDQKGDFYVYRYRMPDGHWAAAEGWLLGLAGPYFEGDPPYAGHAGAFSRIDDRHGDLTPDELTDWYVSMATGKSVAKG